MQRKATKNLLDHVERAITSFNKGNPYNLTKAQKIALVRFQDVYEESKALKASVVTAYELKFGMTEGFQLATNQKYPSMMVLKEIKGK